MICEELAPYCDSLSTDIIRYDAGQDLAQRVRKLEALLESSQGPPSIGSSSSALGSARIQSPAHHNHNLRHKSPLDPQMPFAPYSAPESAVRMTAAPTRTSEVSNDAVVVSETAVSGNADPLDSSGTLVVESGGRAKYIGPSASSQYHREVSHYSLCPPNHKGFHVQSRPASPTPRRPTLLSSAVFPGFISLSHPSAIDYEQACTGLPSSEEVAKTIDTFFRLVAWTGSPILREDMDSIAAEILHYAPEPPRGQDIRLSFHKLALVFIVLALGGLMNMEVPPNDPETKAFFAISQNCLFHGLFLSYNTLTCVQALVSLSAADKYISKR